MTYRDLLDVVLIRAQRLGLVDPESGKADGVELLLYMYQALLSIVELTDLEEYTSFASVLTATAANVSSYALPEDFGRLILPRALAKRGLTLVDGLEVTDLNYEEPNALTRKPELPVQRPTAFTVLQRQLVLSPIPDGPYVVRGLYVAQVNRPALEAEVLLQHPDALIQETLWRLAGDMGKLQQMPGLTATRTEALARLVGGATDQIQQPRLARQAPSSAATGS